LRREENKNKMPTLFILTKTPYVTNDVTRVIRTAMSMRKANEDVGIILIQDAVVTGIRGITNKFGELLTKALKAGIKIYILGPDAVARGLSQERVLPGIEFVDYGQWVDIVIEKYERIANWT
jgi:tRNA 2-thiouridine synthesizing protein B